jgi:hypothetical protein
MALFEQCLLLRLIVMAVLALHARSPLPDHESEAMMLNRAGMSLAVAGLLAGLLAVSSPVADAAAPDVSAFTFLTGTVALSPSDAWAVGWAGVPGTMVLFSESLHWNGHDWVSVNAAPGAYVNGLQSVSATGPSNIWGVGFQSASPLIEHYNGRTWATVPCPYQGGASQLNGVDARTVSDAWAVGWVNPGSGQVAFAEHWNGKHWAQVTTAPVSGSYVELNSVLDLGPGNVFAVGDYQTKSNGTDVRHELAEHWNGKHWQRVSVPAFSTPSSLSGISGGKAAGVTAVGYVLAGGHSVPLIERWNRTRFARVAQPVGSGYLSAVTVLSRTSAYAVGETGGGTTLVEHYNGTRWTRISAPSPAGGGYLTSVAATPSGSFVAAVGSHGPDLKERPLIEQGNGKTWHIARD